jgi:S-DNA-T family DNA segregation ATPase FtsK/SpoIIIE
MLGQPLYVDVAKLPHMLVAGATNSGKSVYIYALLCCLLICLGPQELQLLLVDPKMVELSNYNGFPHLLSPPITDMRRAGLALNKVNLEMERRYELLVKASVRNIGEYNRKVLTNKLTLIVVVIDEYADLMLVAGKEVEESV